MESVAVGNTITVSETYRRPIDPALRRRTGRLPFRGNSKLREVQAIALSFIGCVLCILSSARTGSLASEIFRHPFHQLFSCGSGICSLGFRWSCTYHANNQHGCRRNTPQEGPSAPI